MQDQLVGGVCPGLSQTYRQAFGKHIGVEDTSMYLVNGGSQKINGGSQKTSSSRGSAAGGADAFEARAGTKTGEQEA